MPSLYDIPKFPDPPAGHFWRVRHATQPQWAYLELRQHGWLFSKLVDSEFISGCYGGVKNDFSVSANKMIKRLDVDVLPSDYAGDYGRRG